MSGENRFVVVMVAHLKRTERGLENSCHIWMCTYKENWRSLSVNKFSFSWFLSFQNEALMLFFCTFKPQISSSLPPSHLSSRLPRSSPSHESLSRSFGKMETNQLAQRFSFRLLCLISSLILYFCARSRPSVHAGRAAVRRCLSPSAEMFLTVIDALTRRRRTKLQLCFCFPRGTGTITEELLFNVPRELLEENSLVLLKGPYFTLLYLFCFHPLQSQTTGKHQILKIPPCRFFILLFFLFVSDKHDLLLL